MRRIKVQRRPLQTGIRASVLEAVLNGSIKPGQKIAIQPLADLLGVSITPVRDALNSLVSEGVLEMLPGGTAIVPKITPAALAEWLWLRRVIEARLIAQGLRRKSVADAAALLAIADAASRTGTDTSICIDAAACVIDRLVALAGQQVLFDNLRRVRNRCGAYLVEAARTVGADTGTVHFLAEVTAALRAGRDVNVERAYDRYQDQIDAAAMTGIAR
jgi:DNA-binding GntR family transcriptional regulator